MQFPKDCRIEKATDPKTLRYAGMRHVRLDVEGKRLLATDGKILARVPVEVANCDVTGPVTEEAIKAARKASGRLDARLDCNGTLAIPGGASFPRPESNAGDFPVNIDQAIPTGEPEYKIALNAEMLYRLAQALGGDVLRLEFHGPKTAIVVNGSKGDGAIMPVEFTEAKP